MIISILFFLAILIITLDSIGSKRLRRQVIKQSKDFFALSETIDTKRPPEKTFPEDLKRFLLRAKKIDASPIQTLRLKLKGAQKKEQAKHWQPVEAKQFQTLNPLAMTYYEDSTPGFLWSIKKYRGIQGKKEWYRRWTFSLFSFNQQQGKDEQWLNWMHLLASLPWLPDLAYLTDLHWEKDIRENCVIATIHINGKRIRAYYTFHTNGQISSCSCVLDEVLSSTSKVRLSYQYFDFEDVESWRVPLRVKIKETQLKSALEAQLKITQLVYNEEFAWW
ncbi:MAG: hypothetical protein Sapg2KO_22200 [Saprospiraceae bacterium]